MTGRDVIVWTDPVDAIAEKLTAEFPYNHEPLGVLSFIKLVVWVLVKTRVLSL